MKKIICLTLTLALLLSITSISVFADDVPIDVIASAHPIKVTLNGEELSFPQPPVMVDDRVLVPLREIFEALGAVVDWDDATQSVTSTKDSTTVTLAIGSNILHKNGNEIYLDVPAQLINDKTMVPVRAVSKALGSNVDWDEDTNTVIILTTKIYYNTGEKDYLTCEHNLDYFVENISSDTYSPELALMLMDLSWSAYINTAIGNQPAETDEDKKNTVIYKSLDSLSFNDIELNEYYNNHNDSRYGNDNCAYAIGNKKLSDGRNLIIVAIRGSVGDLLSLSSDWKSNFNCSVSKNGNHLGFEAAANKVLTGMEKYISKHNLTNNALIITGHSRGAAVGNLVATTIMNKGAEQSNIYSYNFACPDTTTNAKGYPNIFNICNKSDIVTMVPRKAKEIYDMIPPILLQGELGELAKGFEEATHYKWFKNGITLWFNKASLNSGTTNIQGIPISLPIDLYSHAQSEYHRYLISYPEKDTYETEK